MTDFKMVVSDEDLARVCEVLGKSEILALDTEFERSRTFFPKTGLIQAGDASKNYFLLDPLKISNWQPLIDLFENSRIVKIMHSCTEDLEVFRHLFNSIPQPLFDTQVAAACAGYELQLGYQKLVAQLLDVHLEKGETRSDWMKRPLTDSQLHYAVEDIVYLPALHEVLTVTLLEKNRQDLCEEDCQGLINNALAPVDNTVYYKKVKNAWILNEEQLLVLKNLCIWREEEVRALNLPRSFFIPDNILWSIAKFLPNNQKALLQVQGVDKKWMNQYDGIILDVIFDSLEVAYATAVPAMRKPLGREAKDLFEGLKTCIRAVADVHELDPSVICRKKIMEKLVDHVLFDSEEFPVELTGWRKTVIAGKLEDIIRQHSRLAGDA